MEQKSYKNNCGTPENTQIQKQQDSIHLQEYLTYFGFSNTKQIHQKYYHLSNIFKDDLEFHPEGQFIEMAQIKVVAHSNNYQFIDIVVNFGFFTFKNIVIAISNTKSPTHFIQNRCHGNFGSVFQAHCYDNQIAIKCCSYQQQNIKSTLFNVISQYCLLKLASILKVGPYMSNYTGYDIIVYRECIQIAMQLCFPVKKQQNNKLQTDLKQNLMILHNFGFVHFDIKPQNVCFSSQFNKYVFIDFGFSKLIQQSIGSCKLTGFYGSLKYCSPDMQQCYLQNQQRQIDVYYNDCYSLMVTFTELQKIQTIIQELALQFINDLSISFLPAYLKYLLYRLQIEQFKNIWNKYPIQITDKISFSIISFIRSLNYCIYLQQIHILLINPKQTSESVRHFRLSKSYNYSHTKLKQEEQINNQQLNFNHLIFTSFLQIYQIHPNAQTQNNKDIPNEDIFLDQSLILKFKKNVYFAKLAKVIQINSDICSLSKKKQYSEKALSIYPFQQNIMNSFAQNQHPALCQASLQIFEWIMSDIFDNQKAEALINIIYNIIILQLLPALTLLSAYNKILNSNINFIKKVQVLLHFLSTSYWAHFNLESKLKFNREQENFYTLNQKYRHYLETACQSQQQKAQTELFDIIFFTLTQQNKLFNNQLFCKGFRKLKTLPIEIPKQFSKQILNWVAFLSISFEHKYADSSSSWLQKQGYKKSFENQFIFENMHLMLIHNYYDCNMIWKAKSLISKFFQIFGEGDYFKKFTIFPIYKMIQLKTSTTKQLSDYITYILNNQEYFKHQKINKFVTKQLVYMRGSIKFNQLPQQLIHDIFNSDVLYCYKMQVSNTHFLYQTIFGNIITMKRQMSMRKGYAKEQLYDKYQLIYIQQKKSVFSSNIFETQANAMISLNLTLAFLLMMKEMPQKGLQICYFLLDLVNRVNYFQQSAFQFQYKIIIVIELICRFYPQLQQKHHSIQIEYEYNKRHNVFHPYFESSHLLKNTFMHLLKNKPDELINFIQKIGQHLNVYSSAKNIDIFSINSYLISQQIEKEGINLEGYSFLYKIKDIPLNPHLGIFLNHIRKTHLSSTLKRKIFIQISESLNYVSRYAKQEIESTFYIQATQEESIKNCYKKCNKLRQKHVKYGCLLNIRLKSIIKLKIKEKQLKLMKSKQNVHIFQLIQKYIRIQFNNSQSSYF